MSITAIVENDMIKLPVHVPDGTKVEITLPRTTSGGETEHARLKSDESGGKSLSVKSFFGSFASGGSHGADNERIDHDLVREAASGL